MLKRWAGSPGYYSQIWDNKNGFSGSRSSRQKQDDGKVLQLFLADPQQLNSYNYARNNPITFSDPTGEIAFLPLILNIFAVYGYISNFVDAYAYKTVVLDYPEFHTVDEINQAGNKVLEDLSLFGVGRIATNARQVILDVGTASLDVLSHYFGSQMYRNVHYNQIQSQTIPQDRYNAVQDYNNSIGASAPEDKLWTTPSGAVVTWSGELVAGPTDE